MNCVFNATGLFEGPNLVPAVVLAALSFVLGMIVMKIVGGMCRCGAKNQPGRAAPGGQGKAPAPRQNDDRPFEKRKPHPAPTDGSVEIYVGNLSYEMTEEQLRREFEAYGKVNSARLIVNRASGKSKGFGFVNMPVRTEAEKAVEALNDKDIMGRKMKCNEAKNLI